MAQDKVPEGSAHVVWPQVTGDETALYANGILVSHTPWDFVLHFAQILPPIASGGEPVPTEIKAKRIAIVEVPVPLLRGLIKALQTNLDLYEENYGKVTTPKTGADKDGNGSAK